MNIIFDQYSCKNIERKYAHIGLNQFKNDYLREVAVQATHLRQLLRVFSGGYELKLPNIVINQENYNIVSGYVQQNLGSALQKKVNQAKFYSLLKQQNIKDNDQDDKMKVAMFNFYKASGGVKYQKIYNSNLLNLQDSIFFVNSLKITKQQSEGLKNYLQSFNQDTDMHTKQIIIDQCLLDDEILDNILDGCLQQSNQYLFFGQMKKFQSLLTFIANKIPFGKKSLQKIMNFIPDLVEIKLNGLIMQYDTFVPYLDEIFQKYIYFGKYLMKMTISNMNLNNMSLMSSLVLVLREKKHLQYLDFNNTNLNPDYLQILSNEMENQCMQYRDINLSYNELDFQDEQSAQYKTSYLVLQNLRHILEHNVILNHLNLSGMKFLRNQMMEIFNSCMKSPLLMTLHLNDNGVNIDHSMFVDALEIFKIDPNDLPPQRKVLFPESTFFRESIQPDSQFDLENKIKSYFRYQKNNQKAQKEISEIDNLKKLKENIIIGKELKDLERFKSINQCKFSNGIGRIQDSQQDYFTLTRILNHPELIFNQNLNNDSKQNLRFFQKDHQSCWKLSVRSECFICDRNQYLMIFYQRGVLAWNQDLTEIFDQSILNYLQYEYKKNYTIYKSDTPLICGSIVNKNNFQNIFDRKLKMLRTPIFSMLSIIQAKDFANRSILVKKVKEGIQNYLKHDKIEYLELIDTKLCMDGWEQIINDMALNNELYDLKVINLPNLVDTKISQQNWYTFAGFYNAGYHQILIYDPLINRAFCKDFVLHLNQRDFVYPEYPTPQGSVVSKNVPNMWSKWLEDTEEDLDKVYIQDAYQNFDAIDKFIRNKEDTKRCLYIIRDYFARILIYQKELFVLSKSYPQIDWEAIYYFIEKTQNAENFEMYKIQRAQVELQFIQSNRKPGQAILGGSLKRCDLIEFLLRMAKTAVTDTISAREMVSKHLSSFLRTYVGYLAEISNIYQHRRIIRNSSKLNELLFDNNQGLSQIFDDAKKNQGKGLFDLKTARQFFGQFNQQGILKLKHSDIDECFIFSMMTIHNEKQHSRKYDYLVFVEFQELLCRLAYIGFEEQDTIEYKVYWLLQFMWKDRYKKGIWVEDKIPLKQINNEILL